MLRKIFSHSGCRLNSSLPFNGIVSPGSAAWENFGNSELKNWVLAMFDELKPSSLHLVEGTMEEQKYLENMLCAADDVARLESFTFICSREKRDAGPTNNWASPEEMKKELGAVCKGAMEGRTMYVVPFLLGPSRSPMSRVGVEITDSPYAVLNLMKLARVGRPALNSFPPPSDSSIPDSGLQWVRCLHTLGSPLRPGVQDTPWPSAKKKYISHFPESKEVISFGSGYGGNALLNKKCFALRLGSVMGREEGWFAEHMLLAKVTPPSGEGRPIVIAAAFPSACGKTNLAMLQPTLPGWKVECIGDDISWLHPNGRGGLKAINPEQGFFGVAPGTSDSTNPMAMATVAADTIFTNCALTLEGDVWWEGKSPGDPPKGSISWLRKEWRSGVPGEETAAHPNARFSSSAFQCPSMAAEWDDPKGVNVDAIIFGGRRSDTLPLVYQTLDWEAGVWAGATMSSERTAAAEGKPGELRYDPFAMAPFCGYNMGDYFQHWLNAPKLVGDGSCKGLPPIFHVNWFRKEKGAFLWPGFGENIRVLKWIHARVTSPARFERVGGEGSAIETPIGFIPTPDSLDVKDLRGISPEDLSRILAVDRVVWRREVEKHMEWLSKTFKEDLPLSLLQQGERLLKRME